MATRTALWEVHDRAGATFTEFAGFEMPVHFGSIKGEHEAVRQAAGLFDVSHMSNVWLHGADALTRLSAVSPRSLEGLPEGKGQYTVLLNQDGTILDDVFAFRVEAESVLLVPNAGRAKAVVEHLARHAPGAATVADASRDWAILALQGPRARAILERASDDAAPKFRNITTMQIGGEQCLVSGTGYTGEKGVEVYVPGKAAHPVWDALQEAGAGQGLISCGLGARDTLRLEKGYCLAGNEFAGGRTPVEASLGWLIDWQHDFLGRGALQAQRDEPHDVLQGLVLDKGIPRPGYHVHAHGQSIGQVTSGTLSPTLGQGIALAYLRGAALGDTVSVDVRGRAQDATVVAPPFV